MRQNDFPYISDFCLYLCPSNLYILNRKKGPQITNIHSLVLPESEIYTLPNGIRICEINLGSQEIIKFEIFHAAGRTKEEMPLASRAVSSLIKDGTATKTSAQLSEEIDFYGSSIKTASNMDFSYSTLFALTKQFHHALPILHDMYYRPSFPDDEIEKFKLLNIQKLREELTKNEVITYRHFTEDIFGKYHPYGFNSTESDYLALTSDAIRDHHLHYYGSDNCYIFVSGKITQSIRNQISDLFGTEVKMSKQHEFDFQIPDQTGKKISLTSKNEHQSALKTGRHLFNKDDQDHPSFFLLNVILGGYFGSRLMMSIREDKGYTYDISSSMDQMLHDGCFYISTEAAPEYIEPILVEVYHQMNLLKQEKIGTKEFSMVKNYLMGTFMNMLDGPLNVSSLARTMILTGKKPEDFLIFCDKLMSITPETILNTAQKYLNEDEMTEVVVSPDIAPEIILGCL